MFSRFLISVNLISLVIQAGVCVTPTFDKKMFTEALSDFRKNPVVHKIKPFNEGIPKNPGKANIPEEVVSDFQIIQHHLFGDSKTIHLKPCSDGCEALASVEDNSVYLEPSFIEKIQKQYPKSWRSIIRFVLAHEVSHFVHECIVHKRPNRLSPQGNPTLLSAHSLLDEKVLKQKEPELYLYRMSVRMAKSHSEIDGLGLIILEQLGFNDAPATFQYLTDLTDEVPGINKIDPETRARNVKKVFLPSGISVPAECFLTEDEEVALRVKAYQTEAVSAGTLQNK